MTEEIHHNAIRRGITRLCHFTPSRNLVHIATDPEGVLATTHLKTSEKAVFNPTDLERLDGCPTHICCSVQYPNAWYFQKARNKDCIFRDWVVLLIKPHYLWMPGTKFCPRNAAAGRGRTVQEGANAFEALFSPRVLGAHERTYTRTTKRLPYLPTDEQAEVLIPYRVAREDLLGVVVFDEAQARREIVRLQQLEVRIPPIVIARDFFDPQRLTSMFRSGQVPDELEYYPGDDNG